MKPGPTPSQLDDLLLRAEHFAGFAMRQFGRVPPAMMALSPGGLLFFMPEKMGDERAKDSFANTARLVCIAHDASAVVVILEAWMKVAAPGETLDPEERPSEAFDRREVVVLSGEARGATRQKFLPIIRTDAGDFFGFGESDLPEFDNFKGRFAEILPPHPPGEKAQAKARLLLKAMGVTDDDLMQGEARWS
jgi:hypothetical protein